MKGGGFIVFLFLLVCFLWGVTAVVGGMRATVRSWFSRAEPAGPSLDMPSAQIYEAGPAAPVAQKTALANSTQETASKAVPLRGDVGELRELFALFRQGALTREEYEQFKQHLLSALRPAVAKTNPENP